MKAYEAGIKLAAHEFFGKFANEEDRDRLMEMYNDPNLTDGEREDIASEIEALENAAMSENEAPEASPSQASGPGFLDSLRSYIPTEGQMDNFYRSNANLGNDIMSGLGQAGDYISNMFGGGGATESAPKTPLEYEAAMARNYIPEAQPQQPAPKTPLEYEAAMARNYIPEAQPQQQAQAPAPEKPMGPPRELQNFTAVRGGYGKQLKALRGMGGLSQDARDLLGQTNYRQLASAMGNRGLRVGDQFSVQDLLGRLRGQQARRDQGASSGEAIGSKSSPIQIQNRRGSTVNRGALRQRPQRTAAPQASAPRPNVRSMVNQLGIKPNQPLNLGPAPSQADLLRSVGAPQAPAAPKPQQGLMSGLQDFPSNIGSF